MEASASAGFPNICLSPSSSGALAQVPRARGVRFDQARPPTFKTRAVTEVIADSLNSAPVDVSWEIIVGSVAGIAPFVVAGIEFSKRINAQRNCTTCKGSGLVRREKVFLPVPSLRWLPALAIMEEIFHRMINLMENVIHLDYQSK